MRRAADDAGSVAPTSQESHGSHALRSKRIDRFPDQWSENSTEACNCSRSGPRSIYQPRPCTGRQKGAPSGTKERSSVSRPLVGKLQQGSGGMVIRPPAAGFGRQPLDPAASRWISPPAAGSRRQPLDLAASRWIRPPAAGSSRQPRDPAASRWIWPPATRSGRQPLDPAASRWIRPPAAGSGRQPLDPAASRWIWPPAAANMVTGALAESQLKELLRRAVPRSMVALKLAIYERSACPAVVVQRAPTEFYFQCLLGEPIPAHCACTVAPSISLECRHRSCQLSESM